MEEKRDYDKELAKKDNLIWNEEDYQTMEKLTGFDEETIENDQRKGIQIIIFVIVCIFMLILGILIGYNIPKKNAEVKPIITEDTKKTPKISVAYTKKNNSGELYLYLLDNQNEEYAIFDLSGYTSYYYNIYNNNLYVILVNDKMSLFKVELTDNGYKNHQLKEFIDEYSSTNIQFVNDLIYFMIDNKLLVYSISTDSYQNIENELILDNILSINDDYILYSNQNHVEIYNLNTNEINSIGENILQATFIGDNVLYFILSNNHETVLFYEYSINDKTNTFIAEGDYNNTILMNINNLYLYNDNNKLYSYDGVSNNEIYEAESKISEISYLNPNEIIIIPDTYTNDDCSLASVKAGILNIQTKKIIIKTINGCLDTKIINDVIFAK